MPMREIAAKIEKKRNTYLRKACIIQQQGKKIMFLFKLGFQPYGLSKFLIHREEDKLAAEEEYKDKLDDRYMALARKFNVEPRRLLSHVLEYRIVV